MIVVDRAVGQDIGPSGGALGTSRMMARIGAAIQLLSDPAELQERIDAFRARQNSTGNPLNSVGQLLLSVSIARRHCKALQCTCTAMSSLSSSSSSSLLLVVLLVKYLNT